MFKMRLNHLKGYRGQNKEADDRSPLMTSHQQDESLINGENNPL